MPSVWKQGRASNPYSVQRHGPGNLEYVFRCRGQREWLDRALVQSKWRVELIGQHGVGKSTLLATIGGWAGSRGLEVHRLRCSGDKPRLPLFFWRRLPRRNAVVLLDGGERCPRLQLWLLAGITRRRGTGLVLTAHRPMGIGRPVRMKATKAQVLRIAESLRGRPLDEGEKQHIATLLRGHGGSAREVLFRLYDEWEDKKSAE
jgi:hypothetical protein